MLPNILSFNSSIQVPDVIMEALVNSGLQTSDVDWLLLHQANIRIMEHAAQVLGFLASAGNAVRDLA